MTATFSFVPTPSVLETRTGSFMPAKLQANMPPNEPISERTPGVKVSRASCRIRFFAALDASISTPASLYVMVIFLNRDKGSDPSVPRGLTPCPHPAILLSSLPTDRADDLRLWRPTSYPRNRLDTGPYSTQCRIRFLFHPRPGLVQAS